jgi:dTDP-4-amino-4,6-dideoxygalactose transaminase
MLSPFIRLISIASSPNVEKEDIKLSRLLLFNPFRWRKGPFISRLEEEFAKKFGGAGAVSFESGRIALWAILKSLGIETGDEVIIQAFTCVVVPDAVIWAGAHPVYVDIRDDFNADPDAIEKAITAKTRVIVVQHTFGIPAEIDKIIAIARKHKIVVIEDCAHTVGGVYKRGLVGSWAPISFFSFGQEKAISSVRGGIVVTKDKGFGDKLRELQANLRYPSRRAVMQRLLHPILWAIIAPTYYFLIGKVILWFSYKLHLITYIVTPQELTAGRSPYFPSRLANSQARLALSQLKRSERFNKKRIELSVYYHRHLSKIIGIKMPEDFSSPLLRFPVKLGDSIGLREYGRRRHILLESWYDTPVYPKGVDMAKVYYIKGSCPVAEKVARGIINLPLNPTMSIGDAARVVKITKEYLKKHES